jgi:hypothetical protein
MIFSREYVADYWRARHMATFNGASILIGAFVKELDSVFLRMFGGSNTEHGVVIRTSATMAMEIIANSNAQYHNVEHSVMVTLVGQQMLIGKKMLEGDVTASDWTHFIVSLLCHDIGYVRSVCHGDEPGRAVIDSAGTMIDIPEGATDAFLTPYHVERGKIFVLRRYRDHPLIDPNILATNISNTQFPVPDDGNDTDPGEYPNLVQAADLVGQMADPEYLRKIPALYQEFRETGADKFIGCKTAEDLREDYPDFFWNVVAPHVTDGLSYLKVTREGREWLASLYAHIFAQEHRGSKKGAVGHV